MVVETFDRGEGCFEAIPLGGVLFAAGGIGERVSEDGVLSPESELLERWAAGEELYRN